MKVIFLPTGGKFYQTPGGLFPSVTTVLQATMEPAKREALARWRIREGNKADQIRARAAQRGILLHQLLDAQSKDQPLKCPEELTSFWSAAAPLLKAVGKSQVSEVVIYHPSLGYAGTVDRIAQWRSQLAVIDFKTTARPKPVRLYDEAKLQVAAYSLAYESSGVKVPIGLVAVISSQSFQIIELDETEMRNCQNRWLERLERYQNLPLIQQLLLR